MSFYHRSSVDYCHHFTHSGHTSVILLSHNIPSMVWNVFARLMSMFSSFHLCTYSLFSAWSCSGLRLHSSPWVLFPPTTDVGGAKTTVFYWHQTSPQSWNCVPVNFNFGSLDFRLNLVSLHQKYLVYCQNSDTATEGKYVKCRHVKTKRYDTERKLMKKIIIITITTIAVKRDWKWVSVIKQSKKSTGSSQIKQDWTCNSEPTYYC